MLNETYGRQAKELTDHDFSNAGSSFRLAGRYVCFDESRNYAFSCTKGIITVRNGEITDISEYKEGIQGVAYLDDDQVIFPGLLNIHNHAECNMYQLYRDKLSVGTAWDNRFEWRDSAHYTDLYVIPENFMHKNWSEPLAKAAGKVVTDTECKAVTGAECKAVTGAGCKVVTDVTGNSDLTVGDMVAWYAELQALAGGTVLLQEDDNSGIVPFLDSHRKMRMIRSTSDGRDLGRINDLPCLSVVQLYTPDHQFDPTSPETFMPHFDTSSWKINEETAANLKQQLQERISAVKKGKDAGWPAFLIHLAEGRAGNLTLYGADAMGTDAYCTTEFQTFKNSIEAAVAEGRYTVDDVRGANICLIHACAVDPKDSGTRVFLKKYGIALISSPVSNLLLYEDTPKFYNHLDDDEIVVCISSDWTPSGSKTIWDELKFVYHLAIKNGQLNTITEQHEYAVNVLKAATVKAAKAIGSRKLGNIAVGKYADFMILDTGKADPLDAFYSSDETKITMVYVGGDPMYGDLDFYKRHVKNYEDLTLASIPSEIKELNDKYYNITGKCGADEINGLLDTFIKLVEEGATAETCRLRSLEDPVYLQEMQRLFNKFLINHN